MIHVKFVRPLLAALLLVASSLACDFSLGPPAIGEVVVAETLDADYKPVNPTSTYTSDDTVISVSVEVQNLVLGSVVEVKYKLDGADYESLTSTADKEGSGYYGFTLTLEDGLLPGDYAADVYLDGKLAKSVTFKVEASGPPSIGVVVSATGFDEFYKPVAPTSTYATSDTVYISVQVKNLVVGSEVTVKYFIDGEHADADTTLVAENAGSSYYGFSLTPPLPAGIYTAEIYLDDALFTTLAFSVQ